MVQLVLAFVEIAFHRRGPDQLPASRFLLAGTVVAYLCVGLLIAQFAARSPAMRLFLITLDFAAYCTFVWLVLKAFGRERRFVQTLTALLGVETLLGTLVLAIHASAVGVDPGGYAAMMLEVLWLVLIVWSIDVAGFVLARAIERPYFLGAAVMLAYASLTISLHATFFPVSG